MVDVLIHEEEPAESSPGKGKGSGKEPPPRETQINLDEARLQAGDVMQLQSLNDERERFSVRLIGYSRGRSVLVTTPMVDEKYLLIRDGQAFVVRAFSGRNAYAFSTQVLKSVNVPYPHLHLAYPRDVRALVVRRGARAVINVICSVLNETGDKQTAALMINVSIGGALLSARQAMGEAGDRVTVKFKTVINEVEAFFAIPAVIRAINEGEEKGEKRYGLEFTVMPGQDMILLSAFVYQNLLEQSMG